MVPDAIADGGQTDLESWSNDSNVFQFIRIEDIAYDRNDPRTVYMADTGEPRAVPDGVTGRLRRGSSGTNGEYMNGRIWKLELGADPMEGTLSILPGANFDLGGYANAGVVHQPDNVETTENALYIGGHRVAQLVVAREHLPGVPGRDERPHLALRPEDGRADGCRDRRPLAAPRCRQGVVGVQRHRRRVCCVRQGRVPRRRPGARPRTGDGFRKRLRVPPRGGTAPAAPRSQRVGSVECDGPRVAL